jgi:hypothetical protein
LLLSFLLSLSSCFLFLFFMVCLFAPFIFNLRLPPFLSHRFSIIKIIEFRCFSFCNS